MSQPIPKVKYRIQNVEYATFLELPAGDSDPVKVRPLKASEKQQWTFVESPGNKFMIQNVSNDAAYLGFDTSAATVFITEDIATAAKWKLTLNKNDNAWEINSSQKFLQLSDKGEVLASKTTRDDDQRWTLNEVTTLANSLFNPNTANIPSGLYRIRSLNGIQLLTMPQKTGRTAVYITKQEVGNLFQRWFVEPKGNDKYQIKNIGRDDVILGCENRVLAQGVKVSGLAQTTSFDWDLNSIGGFGHIISVQRGEDRFAVGFANYIAENNDEAILMPSKAGCHSQIWLFEPWERLSDDSKHLPAPLTNPLSLPTANYQIINRAGGSYPYMYWNGSTILLSNSATSFTVTWRGDYIEIEYGGRSLRVRDGTPIFEVGTPARWVLMDAPRTNEFLYFISLYGAENPWKVLTGDTSRLSLVDISVNEEKHMWRFNRV